MNQEIIHLEIECAFCKENNYFEDETGFYTCANCGVISEIRCGAELDYTFPMRTMKSKINRNNEEENSDEENNNDNINDNIEILSQKYSSEGETLMNISTVSIKSSKFDFNNLSNNFNDISSLYSRSTKKKEIFIEKTPQQKLIEIQQIFCKIIHFVFQNFFENKNLFYKYQYFNSMMKFNDLNEKKILYGITKTLLINFISNKYDNIFNPITKQKKFTKSRIRSRNNSINEENNNNNFKFKNNNNNNINKKKTKIKFKSIKPKIALQIKLRRITSRNVYKIYENQEIKKNNNNNFYNEKNFQENKIKLNLLKKFINEYDEVINFIKNDKCFDIVFVSEEDKEKINIYGIIEYEQLIKVCYELGINPKKEKNNLLLNHNNDNDDDSNFNNFNDYESLIHLIFIKQQLKYNNNNINEENNIEITNGINSNHFIFLIYQIFSYKKINLLLNDLLFLYNNFNSIKSLSSFY